MWEVLCIAPTDDPRAIRRAYAARLRQIDPDRDRAGFAQLRDALESALAWASRPRQPASERLPEGPPPDLSEQEPDCDGAPIVIHPEEFDHATDLRLSPIVPPRRHEPRPTPPPADTTSERALLVDLESALQRRDAQEAVRLHIRASATGALPLGGSERRLARLFDVALGDARLDPGEFRALARTFGWDRPQLDSAASGVRERVAARLAAEDWYDSLAAIAAHRRRLGRKWVRAARLVLRRIRGWGLFRIHRPTLQTILDEYARHETWLHDRIAPAWITTLKRRMRRRELFGSAVLVFFLGGIFLDAVALFVSGAMHYFLGNDDSLAFLITIPIALLLFGVVWMLLSHVVDVWRRTP